MTGNNDEGKDLMEATWLELEKFCIGCVLEELAAGEPLPELIKHIMKSTVEWYKHQNKEKN